MEEERLPMQEIVDESDRLIARARQLFDEMERDTEGLPSDAFPRDRPLSIVFAGQYSAGKSSLVKALTGIQDIEVGHGVTTQVATPYSWHDMVVVDTPGIGTGLGACREHDTRTLEAISKADVLVYVVTSEGFDNLIAREFRSLVIDGDKAGETILVVNKMMSCAEGNTPEQRAVIERDLAEVTSPYTPQDLNVVYVDAASHLRSVELEGQNPRMSSILREDGNLADLEEMLDSVSRGSDVAARLTTPLYQVVGEVDGAIAGLGDIGSEEERQVRQRLREQHAAIVSMRSEARNRAQGVYVQAASDVRDEGRALADDINACETEEDAEDRLAAASQRVEEIETECVREVDGLLQECADGLEVAREEFVVSLGRDLGVELERAPGSGGLDRAVLDRLVREDVLRQGSDLLIRFTVGDAAQSGLKAYRASEAHKFFREATQVLGIKLKPWGAVRLARSLNYLGRALGAAGIILPFLLEIKDEHDARKRDEVASMNRGGIRSQFNDEARRLVSQCEEGIGKFDAETIQPKLEAIDDELASLASDEKLRSAHLSKLVDLRSDCMRHIRAIHRWQKGATKS